MSKIDNLKTAAFEMFGIGDEAPTDAVPENEAPVETMKADPVETETASEVVFPAKVETPVAPASSSCVLAPSTYLAPGVVIEGTLRSKGNVEIAGTFKGDIYSDADVILHTGLEGNVVSHNLSVIDCTIVGDCTVTSMVQVDENSTITGNIVASELDCSGKVEGGNIRVRGNAAFTSTAVINANITAGSISMERGAKISGRLTMED